MNDGAPVRETQRSIGAPDLSPPCRMACPLDKDVPSFLRAIALGDTERAWQIALRDNLFPGVLGWICPRPCESVCRRKRLEGPIPICRLKRWVGDQEGNGKHPVPRFEGAGPRVAVIGAGPSGLAAAHDLTVLGARVTVFDERDEPGGLLASCIPGFRLPTAVVKHDVERIFSMGATFHPRTRVSGLAEAEALLAEGFASVLLAIGGGRDRTPSIEGWRSGPDVTTAIEFLERYRAGVLLGLHGRTVVIGGGNAALDVARTAIRLGADPVEVVYRRGWAEMPALPSEVEEARGEGVAFRVHTFVREVVWEGDRLIGVRLATEGPGPRSDRAGGSDDILPASRVIAAIGQSPLFSGVSSQSDLSAAASVRRSRIFACGDCVSGPTTVAEAIASGRQAAARIRATLERDGIWPRPDAGMARLRDGIVAPPAQPAGNGTGRIRFRSAAPPDGDGVWDAAVEAASACFRCDQILQLNPDRCVLCGECTTRCAEDSLHWTHNPESGGFLLSVDDSTCTRCGDCVAGCPVGAIHWSRWTRPNRNIAPREILVV